MKSLKLKICGMKECSNILDVAKMKPDYMGFIFYDRSPRFVGENFEIPAIPKSIKKVGVFVNEDVTVIKNKIDQYKLDYVQLHGNESVEDCQELMNATGVIKIFPMNDAFDFETVNPYRGAVNFFLFDTKGGDYGGNGVSFTWEKLGDYDQSVPFFLSGGLSIQNVHRVCLLEGMNIHGLDLNSGIEILPGRKSIKKIDEIKQIMK